MSPLLRQDKTESFEQLENDLSQYRIDLKSVHTALQNYLSRFEEIANIETLNGYIDGDHAALDASTYYLVGKSSSENTYYWRSLDLPVPSTATRQPASTSFMDWSDWKKIDIVFPEELADQTLRPVTFNNRLFVVWAEVTPPGGPIGSSLKTVEGVTYREDDDSHNQSRYPKVQVKYAHKKFDGSWSTPQTVIDRYYQSDYLALAVNQDRSAAPAVTAPAGNDFSYFQSHLQTVAIYDKNLDRLFIGVKFDEVFFQAVGLNHHHTPRGLATVGAAIPAQVDASIKHFAHLPSEHHRKFIKYSTVNKDRFQYIHHDAYLLPSTVIPLTFSNWNADERVNTHLGALEVKRTSPRQDPFNSRKMPDHFQLTSKLTGDFLPLEDFLFEGVPQGAKYPFTLKVRLSKAPANSVSTRIHIGITFSSISQLPASTADLQKSVIQLVLEHSTSHEQISIDLTQSTTTFLESENGFVMEHESNIPDDRYDVLTRADNIYSATLSFHSTSFFSKLIYREPFHLLRTPPVTHLYRHVIMAPIKASAEAPEIISDDTMAVLTGSASLDDYEQATPRLRSSSVLSTSLREAPFTETKYFAHGVLVYEPNGGEFRLSKTLLQYVSVTLEGGSSTTVEAIAPRSSRLGEAEFIDFTDTDVNFPPLRTNTRFAKKLVRAASLSLDHFFSLRPETWEEPETSEETGPEPLDFHGAHGKSFWEVFIFLPWSVAYRLNQEGRYQEAETWLGYIFDPKHPPYWNLGELTRTRDIPGYALAQPYDPNHLALSNPAHLRKSLYMLYLDILINRGDAAYRELTPDSLGQAKLRYVQASQLLGPRPAVMLAEPWGSISLGNLAQGKSAALRQLEKDMPLAVIPIAVKKQDATPWLKDTGYLLQPFNPALTARWDKLESRLYNLRHNLDINSNPLHLTLFAQSPSALAFGSPNAVFGAGATPAGGALRSVSHYRFQALAAHAMGAVDHIIQFGNTLLSLIERQEQAEHLQLQQQHAWDLAKIVVEQHTQALLIDQKNLEALQAGRALIEARVRFFAKQLNEGISQEETAANEHHMIAASAELVAAGAGALAGVAMLAPNIFGFSNGGMRWEGLAFAAQATAEGVASASRNAANMLDRSAQFARRAEEWAYAKEQADLELVQLDSQFKVYQQQAKASRLQLQVARTSLAQTWSIYQLLNKRFSRAQLYQWLNGQLATLYHEAYGIALSLCLDAEACWRFELAKDRSFFQKDTWNNNYRGLLAGESLKLDLMKMSKAYVEDHRRDLEIVKTLSLRQKMTICKVGVLTPQAEQNPSSDPWSDLMRSVISGGTLTFELPQGLFEADYPGQMLRRIKSISVSLPATLGPYEDIKAILTQTSNTILGADDKPVFTDKRSNQQVALSTGFDDSGQFMLNFGDDRYLPFEFTGAISSWTLAFPNPGNQQALLESITDIIVHLRYTARPGTGEHR
ncbi:neuraminidase-like domain-containing protein [Pseudomonas sp. SAICEU22]|uniref:Neuraminidase-like domain-containing protein n=1 Tax=Pseudomonas agronomica TaxID=2979328 RepID=A0ABT3F492_9PSED|nr:neuraminidase-like domain-containing protein [Pseudomonas agronomica]MCW1243911.1 neuraminidase-like domain-containing protein [Pseudomonas agronomica]